MPRLPRDLRPDRFHHGLLRRSAVDLCAVDMDVGATTISDSSHQTSIIVHFPVCISICATRLRFPLRAERSELGPPLDHLSCRYVSEMIDKIL